MNGNQRSRETVTHAVPLPGESGDPSWEHLRKRNRWDLLNQWISPSSFVGNLTVQAGDIVEAGVARASVFGDPSVYDTACFPWAAKIEANWHKVRAELDQVMVFHDQMPAFQEILKVVTPIQSDQKWKTFYLASRGMECHENARRCPETINLLKNIPGLLTAFFSILSPRKHIRSHRGAFNGILRYHLALRVPEPRERVRLRIGNEILRWEEGKSLIFDDSFNHEVWNDTDGYRVVLFVDFVRPLRQPFHWLNYAFTNIGYSFALRQASKNQRQWEKGFYGDNP